MKQFFNLPESKTARGIIIGLSIAAGALLVFGAGMQVGYHQARFEHNFGDNYDRMFVGPHHNDQFMTGGLPFIGHHDTVNDHGAVGEVVRMSGSQFVVAGIDKVEKTITMDTHTMVRQYRDATSSSAIHVGSFVVVIGTPTNTGEIAADVIRLIPPPPGMGSTTPPTASTSQTNH